MVKKVHVLLVDHWEIMPLEEKKREDYLNSSAILKERERGISFIFSPEKVNSLSLISLRLSVFARED